MFTSIRHWLSALAARPRQPDPLDRLSLREFADLPPVHPRADPEPC
jgi:hypothetical protein